MRFIQLYSILLVLGFLVFTGCVAPANAAEPYLLDGFGRVTFAQLGWANDEVVTQDSPEPSVSFALPEGATQGDPILYGVKLKFEWNGHPGEIGDYAILHSKWNGAALYQFKTKRTNDFDDGFYWSMVDLVNGGSQGYELTDTLFVASTNFAQDKGITGGVNEITFLLSLSNASNKDIEVTISKDSEVVATTWQPAFVEGEATARVDYDEVELEVKGHNTGLASPRLDIKALVWRGVDSDAFEWHLGPLEPLGSFELKERLSLAEGRDPERIDVQIDWGTGRHYYIAWDGSNPSPIPYVLQLPGVRTSGGLIVAVVVLWIALPLLITGLKEIRK